jgi:hypothetical protein
MILAIGLLVVYVRSFQRSSSVGSDWVAVGRQWVRVYELSDIRYRVGFHGTRLILKDSGGRKLSATLEELRSERLIWDICFDGMMHSVILGDAHTNRRVHLDLHVPYAIEKS